ncbi:hypothetical protein ARMGADRAFT_1033842 [Armillaria gallica]|uniref:Uncharacterized protein n=1 Tax=Armillaria gallica TaxID=47427 RepID=A0A2H3CZI5_ARMGA|nr:hypothetical protein ARMGADRAFT_1033842 [Armillaria gallica]
MRDCGKEDRPMSHSPVYAPTANTCTMRSGHFESDKGEMWGKNPKSRQRHKEWAHNGNDVRWISWLVLRLDRSTRHPVRRSHVSGRTTPPSRPEAVVLALVCFRRIVPNSRFRACQMLTRKMFEGLCMLLEYILQSRVRSGYVGHEQKAPNIALPVSSPPVLLYSCACSPEIHRVKSKLPSAALRSCPRHIVGGQDLVSHAKERIVRDALKSPCGTRVLKSLELGVARRKEGDTKYEHGSRPGKGRLEFSVLPWRDSGPSVKQR